MKTFHIASAVLTIFTVGLLSLAIPLKNEHHNQLTQRASVRHAGYEVSDSKFTPIAEDIQATSASPMVAVELIFSPFVMGPLLGYVPEQSDSPESSVHPLPSLPALNAIKEEIANALSSLKPSMTPSFQKSHADEYFGMYGIHESDSSAESETTTEPRSEPTTMRTFAEPHVKVIVTPNAVVSLGLKKSIVAPVAALAQDPKLIVDDELTEPLVIRIGDYEANESINGSSEASAEPSMTVSTNASSPTTNVGLRQKKMPKITVEASAAPVPSAMQDLSFGMQVLSSLAASAELGTKKMVELTAEASVTPMAGELLDLEMQIASSPKTYDEFSGKKMPDPCVEASGAAASGAMLESIMEMQISSSPAPYADPTGKKMPELTAEASVTPISGALLDSSMDTEISVSPAADADLTEKKMPKLTAEASAAAISGALLDSSMDREVSASPAADAELTEMKMLKLTAEASTAPISGEMLDSSSGMQISSSPAAYVDLHEKKMPEPTAGVSAIPVRGSMLDSTLRTKVSESIEDDLLF